MPTLALVLLLAAETPPSADALLGKYDAAMGPESFESVATMTANREDGSQRTYKMKILKSGRDKMRVWFLEPSSVKGQEMLRQGENLWIYLPNLKKPTRMASRENFQGGDFNNADVLRVNYGADYAATVADDPAVPGAWRLELTAKTSDAAYERIKLWIGKSDAMPIRGEYYTASGKLLRAAEFSEVRSFGGLTRPSRIVMKNMLAQKRWSVMTIDSMNVKVSPPASKFVLDDLGR